MRGRLRPVEDEGDGVPELIGAAPQPQETRDTDKKVSTESMGLLLRALRETLVASSTLFTLALAASAFWLSWIVISSPTPPQLIGVAIYYVFVLSLEFVRRR